MDIIQAITSRQSIRAFLPHPVEPATIKQILDAAKWAPSSVNMQPWFVHVLTGATRDRLTTELTNAFNSGAERNPDYSSYPKQWVEPYKSRRFACGKALYGALNISHDDKEKRKENWLENYRFFGAPVELIVLIDADVEKGSWLDIGMFIENISLAAQEFGLGSCAQASIAEYPDIVRNIVGVDATKQVVCGIALGYPDWQHPVNNYSTEREPLESFVTWHE